MDRVKINQNCKIEMTIIDKDVDAPPNIEIGYELNTRQETVFCRQRIWGHCYPQGLQIFLIPFT